MTVSLVVLNSKTNHRRIKLKKTALLGRGKDCSLQIDSSKVSRRHCELVIGEGSVEVRDLGSSNGTFLNGQKLTSGELHRLSPSDELALGSVRFRVEFEGAAAPASNSQADSPDAAAPLAAGLAGAAAASSGDDFLDLEEAIDHNEDGSDFLADAADGEEPAAAAEAAEAAPSITMPDDLMESRSIPTIPTADERPTEQPSAEVESAETLNVTQPLDLIEEESFLADRADEPEQGPADESASGDVSSSGEAPAATVSIGLLDEDEAATAGLSDELDEGDDAFVAALLDDEGDEGEAADPPLAVSQPLEAEQLATEIDVRDGDTMSAAAAEAVAERIGPVDLEVDAADPADGAESADGVANDGAETVAVPLIEAEAADAASVAHVEPSDDSDLFDIDDVLDDEPTAADATSDEPPAVIPITAATDDSNLTAADDEDDVDEFAETVGAFSMADAIDAAMDDVEATADDMVDAAASAAEPAAVSLADAINDAVEQADAAIDTDDDDDGIVLLDEEDEDDIAMGPEPDSPGDAAVATPPSPASDDAILVDDDQQDDDVQHDEDDDDEDDFFATLGIDDSDDEDTPNAAGSDDDEPDELDDDALMDFLNG